jgi:hypothetical protein
VILQVRVRGHSQFRYQIKILIVAPEVYPPPTKHNLYLSNNQTLECLSVQQQREGQGSGGVGVCFYLVFIIDGRLGLVNGLRLRLNPDFPGYWTLLDFRILT